MNHHYDDIVSRISEPPKWWDEHAVPRWCEFAPTEIANIYADEVALLLIECQDCGTEFHVAMSSNRLDAYSRALQYAAIDALRDDEKVVPLTNESVAQVWEGISLAQGARDGELHYGDPPNGCPDSCAAGATMNSIPRRVVEFWIRERPATGSIREWMRHPELEVEIEPEWASPAGGNT